MVLALLGPPEAPRGPPPELEGDQRIPNGVFRERVFHRAPQGRRNLTKTGGAKPLGGPSWKTPSPKTSFGTLQVKLGGYFVLEWADGNTRERVKHKSDMRMEAPPPLLAPSLGLLLILRLLIVLSPSSSCRDDSFSSHHRACRSRAVRAFRSRLPRHS